MDVFELPLTDFLKQLVFGLGSEGVVALQHHVEKDAQRPHVCVHRHMVLLGNNFRGHIGWSPTESVNSCRGLRFQTEAKIYQLELFVAVQQDIFCLDVSVYNISFVKVAQSFRYCL